MLHRFATYEEAALFVAHKRSEGYYAEVLHENASVLWGPLAMTGVAAWVSEEAAAEGDEVPELKVKGPALPKEISMTAGLMMIGVPVMCLAAGFLSAFRHDSVDPTRSLMVLAALLLGVFVCVMIFGVFVLLAFCLSHWAHACWSRTSRFHVAASLSHAIIALVLLLIATELGSMLLWAILERILYQSYY